MKMVSKREFRAAQCKGKLVGCEMLWATKGQVWTRYGKPVAGIRETALGNFYYLEA